MQPVRFSAGARRILPRRLKLALQPFGVLKARKGRLRATFQLWSKFRRHSKTPESNSSTMMSWAASAFGWQRRKESDDVKPFVCSISSNARSSRSGKTIGASAEIHWLRGHQHPHSRRNSDHVAALPAPQHITSPARSTPLFARTTAPRWRQQRVEASEAAARLPRSGDVAFFSALRTGARYEGVPATVGARVGTLHYEGPHNAPNNSALEPTSDVHAAPTRSHLLVNVRDF